MSQRESHNHEGRSASTTADRDDDDDDWTHVSDPNERRKIQNRIAQRKFRDKARQLREENERAAENQRRAAGAYTTPEPEDLNTDDDDGLPWGGLSLRHVFETGRAKAQRSSETSIASAVSRAGGGSR